MDGKQVKNSPVKEDVVPAIQELFDDQTQYPCPGTLRAPVVLVGAQNGGPGTLQQLGVGNSTVEVQGNGPQNGAPGTLQQLGVGNSTVEVQGNGSHSVLQIVTASTVTLGPRNPNAARNLSYRKNTSYCPHCSNGFRTSGSLIMHMRACARQHTAGSYDDRQCTVCGKIFGSVSYLKKHMIRHSGVMSIRCDRCTRKFSEESKHKDHMESHKREDQLKAQARELGEQQGGKPVVIKEYRCSFCKHNFTVVFDVGQAKRRYACDACRDKYTSEEPERPKQRQVVCDRCGRKFTYQGYLQRHLPNCDGAPKRPRKS